KTPKGQFISETAVAVSVALGLTLCACESSRSVATSPQPNRSVTPASGGVSSGQATKPLPPDSVPAIAQREVIRRQEQIRKMDEAALRASQAMAEDDLEGAVKGYRQAVDGL
ncbi:MAG: hypothetical protein KDM63_16730, partial [Verrucomicrobiae bacterium]|nr:hypothetical protein [Verrucomicrobiae bacterium]